MLVKDPEQWANHLFSNANLGDERRTKRLVTLSHDMARNIGCSIVKASGFSASIEGAYRFLRNDKIKAYDIAQSAFISLQSDLVEPKTILALEDTTTLNYHHNVTKELGHIGKFAHCVTRGMWAHSVLMVDADTEQTIGLAEQHRWVRKQQGMGTAKERQKRKYETKESYKWQRSSEVMQQRYSSAMNKIISVCDRESDMFDYIFYKMQHQQRFVVRAHHERFVNAQKERLSPYIQKHSSDLTYQVHIRQKGGRTSRIANVEVRHALVTIKPPHTHKNAGDTTLTAISCTEVAPPHGQRPLSWTLYTNEEVTNAQEALKIVRYYELRWRVEEFHKAWKSAGTQVEAFRHHKRTTLEKIIVITAFVAVRLLQLRDLVGHKEKSKSISCQNYFSPLEWRLLWIKTERNSMPKKPPSMFWAYYALAKLGCWHDSKNDGVVGWQALWIGWCKLIQLLEGANIMKKQLKDM
jgi:hypothetical protein